MTTLLTFDDVLNILFKGNGKIIPHTIVTPLFEEFSDLINQNFDNVIKYVNNKICQ
ncbi:MAG: hypothetical protein HeimC3_30320 [Candidatus Heimdallarchaeota archaeon LC_3]|nr:MAG: hypothetical protein HeimC3_30320 [Candidatus Heimdallarchaeota archaeon LC_3]